MIDDTYFSRASLRTMTTGEAIFHFQLIFSFLSTDVVEKKIWFSTIFFTLAVLMKPQGIIFLPVLFFELVRRKSVKSFLGAAAMSLVTALVIVLPFSLHKNPLWLFQLFSSTVGEYPYASVNAFNFFSLLGANYTKDQTTLFVFSYHTWGMIAILLITFFSWFIYLKGQGTKMASMAALIQIAGVFMFSVGMHERYLFPAAALSLLTFIYLKDKRLLWLSAGFSLTSFINTNMVLYGRFNGSAGVPYDYPLILTSLLNVVLFVYLAKVIWDVTRNRSPLKIGEANHYINHTS